MNNLMRKGPQLQTWRKFLVTVTERQKVVPSKSSYEDLICLRKTEAARSIVVQVSSEKSFPELYNYCSVFGNIIGAHHYCVRHEDVLHYILLEYSNAHEAVAAMKASAYNKDPSGVPVRSSFLWFRAAVKNALKSLPQSETSLNIVDGSSCLNNEELSTLLRNAPDINAQINQLHGATKLNELGVRLRFLAALQVQQAVSGMFPNANAQPFGSSVNGFGKMGCDLDLILRFGQEDTSASDSRLVFHTKQSSTNGRSQTQRQMECLGDMLHIFLPGVNHVRRILQARVPIIKYHQEHLNLEVDLSLSNLSGYYMSELLYMFGELDERVRPLTFCIRRWAQSCGLTNPSPGRWITNFSLTCLVIFFLQQLKKPILPSINALVKAATEADIRVTEDGINCTFGRDAERIAFRSLNASQISELLLQFFEFYSQFDFNNRAISMIEGRATPKPDHSPLNIINPLEPALNISKNISLEECERLRIEVRNAAWILEAEVDSPVLPESEKLESSWGLLNLFKTPEKSIVRPNMFFKPRMVEVSDLFEQTVDATPPADVRDANIRKQVQKIKAQGRSDVSQMRLNAAPSSGKSKRHR